MMIAWVADYQLKAVQEFINAVYTYHSDQDIYIPKYGAIDGRAMRSVMEMVTDWETSREGVSAAQFLVSME